MRRLQLCQWILIQSLMDQSVSTRWFEILKIRIQLFHFTGICFNKQWFYHIWNLDYMLTFYKFLQVLLWIASCWLARPGRTGCLSHNTYNLDQEKQKHCERLQDLFVLRGSDQQPWKLFWGSLGWKLNLRNLNSSFKWCTVVKSGEKRERFTFETNRRTSTRHVLSCDFAAKK